MSDILSSEEEKPSLDEDFIPYDKRDPLPAKRFNRVYNDILSSEQSPSSVFFKENKTAIILSFAIAAAIGASIWMIFYFFLNTHPVQVTVTGFEWERSIEVEKYSVLSDSGWSRPSDAYNIERHWRYHYSRDVFSHYEYYQCGTSSRPQTCSRAVYRSEAVYDWYYYYNVDRWVTSRWLTTSGKDQAIYWAEIPNTLKNVAIIGQERVGGTRKTKYLVITDTKYIPSVSEEIFLSLHMGQTGTLNVTRLDKIRSINWNKK